MNALTCIKVNHKVLNFVALVDGGSNVSCISLGLVKALGLSKFIHYEKILAKSWNSEHCTFLGKVKINFAIGPIEFKHQFLVARKLATGTPALLGLDWLVSAEAEVKYKPNDVKLTIKGDKINIPLVKTSTKVFRRPNIYNIYVGKTPSKEEKVSFVSKCIDLKKVQPYMGQTVKLALPEFQWPKVAHIEYCEPRDGMIFESQVVTVKRNNPSAKAKHTNHCNKGQCVDYCPTKPFHYAYAIVYNSTPNTIYLTPNCKLAIVEPQWEDSNLTKYVNTAINTIMGDIKTINKEIQGKSASGKLTSKCKSKKCLFHNGLEPQVNYLHLDPEKDQSQYKDEYLNRHRPKISLEDRLLKVKELLKNKYSNIHPIAKKYILKYPEVVNLDNIPFVGCRSIKHVINYTGPVFYNKQYKTPQVLERDILQEVDRLMQEGLIEPSDSPFSNAYLPVVKYDEKTKKNKIRLCLDLRRLNRGIELDRLHIGDSQELINKLHGAKIMTVLDASSGYLQVDLEEQSKKYTAFRVGNRGYQWTKMCFGLGSAPSSWCRLMQVTLSGLDCVYVYMDDIIIFTKTLAEHEVILNKVFKRLSFNGIELSLKKCTFLSKQVDYLGFTFTDMGLKPQEKQLAGMLSARLPKTLTEARSLLSTFSFYRKFIKNFSHIAFPLIQLTKGHSGKKGNSVKLNPGQDCSDALQELKNILKTRVCLKYPDFSKGFILYTDASTTGLGASLHQRDANGNLKPLCFASRTLTLSESRFPVVELECAAIVWGLKQFRNIILGYDIEIFTDHKPLIYLFRHADPSSRLYRYQLAILEFNVKGIHHISGSENVVSDYLSRYAFQQDEDLDPVTTCVIQSPLSGAIPSGYEYNKSEFVNLKLPNTLIIFAADARNTCYLNYFQELEGIVDLSKFYQNRVGLSELPEVSTLDSSPKLGEVLYEKMGQSYFAMCITNLFHKPDKVTHKQKLISKMYKNDILTGERFKFKLRNDKVHLRDYYFMLCLEDILTHDILKSVSGVQIIWPRSEVHLPKRQKNLQETIKAFSYALENKNIRCCVVNEPEDIDVIVASVSGKDAKYNEQLNYDAVGLIEAQQSDKLIKEIYTSFDDKKYLIVNNILFKLDFDETRGLVQKVFIPESLINSIIKRYHNNNGHPGYARTLLSLRSQCFWPSMQKDVQNFVSQCGVCIQAKQSNNKRVIEGHLVVPPRAGHTWAIDIVGSIPKVGNFSKILVSVCTLSRFTCAVPLASGTAGEVIKKLENTFHILGYPEMLISDNAGAFTGAEFSNYLKSHNIRHHLITPYNPRSNALAERSIQSVLSILRVLCEDKPSDWPNHLPMVCTAINTGFSTSLRERPYFIFFGRDPVTKFGILKTINGGSDKNEIYQMTKYVHELAAKILEKNIESHKSEINKGNYKSFTMGDIVYLQKRFVDKKGYKLHFPFYGPFRVTEVSGNTVLLKCLESGKIKRASMRDIKLFKGEVLTKNDNKNVGRLYPIHDKTPVDGCDMVDTPVSDNNPADIVHPYSLRPRKAKDN